MFDRYVTVRVKMVVRHISAQEACVRLDIVYVEDHPSYKMVCKWGGLLTTYKSWDDPPSRVQIIPEWIFGIQNFKKKH